LATASGVTMAGYGGAAIGFNSAVWATPLQPTASGATPRRTPQRIGSGIVLGDHLFNVSEPQIQCFDVKTGKELWSQRIPGQSFWSSLVATPDRLYATSQNGTTTVFTPDPTAWKPLATNDLHEHTNATPAISNGQLFIRTDNALYCIECEK
jgi:outer membrane protein assembly factor BamB